MQVDALALALRPRPAWEAADLGVRLAQAHAGDVWRCWAPLWAVVTLLALASVEIAPWLPGLAIFCLKPWLDRTLLFVFARAAFGERTRWADLWRAQREVWWRGVLDSLTLRRLSPWRAYTQPLRQLEGQRGSALHKRRRLMLAGKRGAALGVQAAFAHVEAVLVFGTLALVVWFAPASDRWAPMQWLFQGESLAGTLVSAGTYALVVLVVEPFHVAAGFALYLNRRVELEAWDVEREFRHAFGA